MSSLLRTSASAFSALEHHLEQRLAEQMAIQAGMTASAGERRSWTRSLPTLAAALRDADRGGVEMLVEYRLPLTSKRADVVLAGLDARTNRPTYLVVELKQWSEARQFEDNPELVSIAHYGSRPVSHPVVQVRDYCDYLVDMNAALDGDPGSVAGVAYLHNATDSAVADLFDLPQDRRGRMFTGQRRGEFVDYLQSTFAAADGRSAADQLLAGATRPSKQLMALAADEVQRREMFTLLDEQRDAYTYVMHAVEKARTANQKTAVIISGGPGSGKSVIALSLLGELARQGRSVVHATGSQSFTQTLRRVAASRAPRVRKAFQYFNSFMDAEPQSLDCLILDEAHRIRETSANRFTRKDKRTGRPQIDELLSTARVPVFLLDQHQVVRPGELGTVEDIEVAAHERGIDLMKVNLDAQFRCGGSLAFVNWTQRLLGLTDGPVEHWGGDDDFEVHVMASPTELEQWLAAHQEGGYTARMAAGYCWPWSDPRPDGTLVNDVQIGSWSRPWNLKGDRGVGGAPPSALWATDPAGFGQVGCVYTAQGFEYDYAGVIMGPDLVWRTDRWMTDRAGSKDPKLKSRQVSDVDFDRLVRNVYKVLFTRGMRGLAIYSTDPETREHLAVLSSSPSFTRVTG